jgi:hypothetical protein
MENRTFVFNFFDINMKKVAVILVLFVVTVFIVSSCNSKVCPAYSKAETEQPGEVG